MAEQLYNMFAEVGITLDIQKYDLATTNDIVSNSDDYDLYIRGAYNNSGDIVTFLSTSMGFTAINVEADTVDGPIYTDYLDRISKEMDTDARVALYKEFQETFIDDMMYWVPGVQMTIYAAFDQRLADVEIRVSTGSGTTRTSNKIRAERQIEGGCDAQKCHSPLP